MKMITKCFLSLGMLMGSVAYGAQPATPLLQPIDEAYPNSVYFGPELFAYRAKVDFKTKATDTTPATLDAAVRGTRFFAGTTIGYQYLTPDAVYAGIDLTQAVATVDFKATNGAQEPTTLVWTKGDKVFGSVEGRLGYSFAPTHWLVTPYAGAGVRLTTSLDSHNKEGLKTRLPYATVGALSEYSLCTTKKIGLNLKVLRTFNAYQRFSYNSTPLAPAAVIVKDTSSHDVWGAEIGIPVSLQFGDTNRWDVQVEPYFLKLGKTQDVYGANVLFGYRF
ncbi:MAG: hypothetical protein QRY71_05315 [Candidatus Rhabdochlamydia sp.]